MIAGTQKIMAFTVYASLFIQFLTLLLTLRGIFITLSPEHQPLTQIIIIENIVQIIEGSFYILIALSLARVHLRTVTHLRYFDWVITTPIMLLSTVIYFVYTQRLNEQKPPLSLQELWKRYRGTILKIVLLNFGMLLFGFLGETGVLPLHLAVTIGFVFFALVFWEIYQVFSVSLISQNAHLFYFFLIVWGLYGVAALLPVITKNISYNILDIIAKNFYGVFIFIKIMKASRKSTIHTHREQ